MDLSCTPQDGLNYCGGVHGSYGCFVVRKDGPSTARVNAGVRYQEKRDSVTTLNVKVLPDTTEAV